ncbi:MAG TPA: S8 family serine peptidase [Gemmatimonadales bacterium]|nr:S8 family serine peptidase [Gemmatimonadales bacterium]
MRQAWSVACLALSAACAASPGTFQALGAAPDAGPAPPGVVAARADAAYLLPPADAAERGLMPLASSGVTSFRREHPIWDGRGVLIAILDSGIDPGQGGLSLTTTDEPKLLDLRDFSGEGRIALTPVMPAGDSVIVAGHVLRGFGRVRTFNNAGPWYAGTLRESTLGDGPEADVNWNNVVGDTLPVIVTRASDGWVLFADTDGDGSLLNERPVHDYLVARETFGWAPPGHAPALTFAANLSTRDGAPFLDLFFDTSGHGTHVAGIAAGHDLYGVPAFDGVAPGAQVLGLKIANDAHGGISVTGAMLGALEYAIRFAADRRLPLVVNMSFGVGNEPGVAPRIDHLIDSVLARHPDVTFAVSAGNDGPGVSSLGFPGSARRVLSVGATLPAVFFTRDRREPDVLAYFSSRGGESAKPDIVTPGMAYSLVPPWHRGQEVLQGTSMASPYAAGLAAVLASALTERRQPIEARRIRQALMATAQPIAGHTPVGQGDGLPNLGRAWAWLAGRFRYPEVDAAVGAPLTGRGTAAYRPAGLLGPGDTLQAFVLSRPAGDSAPLTLTFRADTTWLVAPAAVTLRGAPVAVTVRYRADALRAPGLHVGVVTGWGDDSMAGALVRLENTVVTPVAVAPSFEQRTGQLPGGAERRWFFIADTGRPFQVDVAAAGPDEVVGAFLHEPGGMPFRDGHEREASVSGGVASFNVDAADVVAGVYEVDAATPPGGAAAPRVKVTMAPLVLSGARDSAGIRADVTNPTASPIDVVLGGRVVGAVRSVPLLEHGSHEVMVPFVAPAWARTVRVDVGMDPDQWARFTDLGLDILDASGRELGELALNYAVGRLAARLPPRDGPTPIDVTLSPGLATAPDTAAWGATLTVRYYADPDSTVPLPAAPAAPIVVAPGARATARYPMPALGWDLDPGFSPLGVLTAQVDGGPVWTRELQLGAPTGLLMR